MGIPAHAEPLSSCAVPPATVARAFPGEVPEAVLTALDAKVGDIAAPGEPFNSTDVVMPGKKMRRVIFVWERGARWVFATEHGGIAYFTPVLAFDLGSDGSSAALVTSKTGSPNTLCATATELIGAS
jgi:hypothetical protein